MPLIAGDARARFAGWLMCCFEWNSSAHPLPPMCLPRTRCIFIPVLGIFKKKEAEEQRRVHNAYGLYRNQCYSYINEALPILLANTPTLASSHFMSHFNEVSLARCAGLAERSSRREVTSGYFATAPARPTVLALPAIPVACSEEDLQIFLKTSASQNHVSYDASWPSEEADARKSALARILKHKYLPHEEQSDDDANDDNDVHAFSDCDLDISSRDVDVHQTSRANPRPKITATIAPTLLFKRLSELQINTNFGSKGCLNRFGSPLFKHANAGSPFSRSRDTKPQQALFRCKDTSIRGSPRLDFSWHLGNREAN